VPKDKPKSVFIYTTLPQVGGNSTIALRLVRLYRSVDCEVTVIVRRYEQTDGDSGLDESVAEEMKRCGARTIFLSAKSSRALLETYALWLKRLFLGDLFISIGIGNLAASICEFGRFRRKVLYYITHDPQVSELQSLGGKIKNFDDLIVISGASIPGAQGLTNRPKRIDWFPQLSELPFKDIESSKQHDRKRMSFGFLGSLRYHKGFIELLEIWNRRKLDADLYILGGGMLQGDVIREAAKSDSIHYLGAFSTQDASQKLPDFFSKIDWLLVPSTIHGEGIPTVILEGFCFGVPSISTLLGGTVYFLEEPLREPFQKFIRLIEPKDIERVIDELISNQTRLSHEEKVACRQAYLAHFGDSTLESKWLSLLESGTRAGLTL